VNVVYKYAIPIKELFELEMPQGAKILDLQLQFGEPVIWAAVDPSQPMVKRKFGLLGTGGAVNFKLPKHVGTFQMHGGSTVLHLFELPTTEAD
jgi:hypothetical protein